MTHLAIYGPNAPNAPNTPSRTLIFHVPVGHGAPTHAPKYLSTPPPCLGITPRSGSVPRTWPPCSARSTAWWQPTCARSRRCAGTVQCTKRVVHAVYVGGTPLALVCSVAQSASYSGPFAPPHASVTPTSYHHPTQLHPLCCCRCLPPPPPRPRVPPCCPQAFRDHRIGPHHFSGSTGYGHGDLGREALDSVSRGKRGNKKAVREEWVGVVMRSRRGQERHDGATHTKKSQASP